MAIYAPMAAIGDNPTSLSILSIAQARGKKYPRVSCDSSFGSNLLADCDIARIQKPRSTTMRIAVKIDHAKNPQTVLALSMYER
jgi:hypothetical protein